MNPPLLTAQGEIAIDIDDEHVRTRSSWAIRCIRGTTRSLELRMDEDDEVTELMIDDQSVDSGYERMRGTGKLMVRLGDPLQTGTTVRLVMKTSRPLAGLADARRVSFAGFPFAGAGAIGFHRDHSECESVGYGGDFRRRAQGRHREVAG